MSESDSPLMVKTPWHLWLIGTLAVIWNSVGVMDFVMTQTKNESYLSSFSEEQLEFFYAFPSWINILWAIAVFGAVLGSLLLLLKRKDAFKVFALAFVCVLLTTIRNYGFAGGLEITGVGGLAFTLVILVFSLLLTLYARAMARKSVLL